MISLANGDDEPLEEGPSVDRTGISVARAVAAAKPNWPARGPERNGDDEDDTFADEPESQDEDDD
jgi:hypothetical protein